LGDVVAAARDAVTDVLDSTRGMWRRDRRSLAAAPA
jgi:hypothetical protein